MRIRRTALVSVAAAAAIAGGAVAATSPDRKQAEDAVITDAAKRLNVTPERLREALGAAIDAHIDQAVRDGKLTQEEADAIKERRRAEGRVLGLPHGGPGHPHGAPGRPHGAPGHQRGFGPRGFGRRGPGRMLADVAAAVGITPAQLRERLRGGDRLSEIAEAEGKTVEQVAEAVEKRVAERLEKAVRAGRLTGAERDAIAAHAADHVRRLAEGFPRHPRRRGAP